MNKEQAKLQEIRARADAATEGKWERANKSVRVEGEYGDSAPTGYDGGICNCLGIRAGLNISKQINAQAKRNAEFIAHARQDIPFLLGLIESLQRETVSCEVIKFARAGEKSDKMFSAHIFPEEQTFTVEVRAYNGETHHVAGDICPREEYENYDPLLVFEFYQKESVVALRDTCNWIIDTLEENDADHEPKGDKSK